LRTSSGPTFRVDHTVIDPGYHRLPTGTITGAPPNYCCRGDPVGSARPANGRLRRILLIAPGLGEGLRTEPAAAAQPAPRELVFAPKPPVTSPLEDRLNGVGSGRSCEFSFDGHTTASEVDLALLCTRQVG